ncbi:hypothetical protein [Larkinella terrae]|uniref:Uncharacterized protein n=1 Tax=Larkinella terrae TaxID=2025311 RepID=A0A7K0ED71_9BACT|nr:hypothetical protein [Larkinella terrae]MRS59850.1 hypothetical protein [Larkinella terrae]
MESERRQLLDNRVFDQYSAWLGEWIHIVERVLSDISLKQMGKEIEIDLTYWTKQLIKIRESFDSKIETFRNEIEDNIFNISDESNRVRYFRKLEQLTLKTNLNRSSVLEKADYVKYYFIDKGQNDQAFQFFHIAAIALPSCFEGVLKSIYEEIFGDELKSHPIFIEKETSNNQLLSDQKAHLESSVKLQWNCKPAIAGYIISELIRAGYIDPPTTHGDLSYAKLASICFKIFDIQNDGRPTTLDYLKKVVNPESNSLPDYKRAKLKLPDLDQLA